MVQGELPTIDTGGKISSPNVQSGTGGTKSKSKSNGGKRKVSRLTQFIHATLHL